ADVQRSGWELRGAGQIDPVRVEHLHPRGAEVRERRAAEASTPSSVAMGKCDGEMLQRDAPVPGNDVPGEPSRGGAEGDCCPVREARENGKENEQGPDAE